MPSDSHRIQGTAVLLAGYGYHDRPFYASRRDGLSSYLIRLQTEGTASALVGGEMVEVHTGDLLLYRPGDAYALSIAGCADDPVSGDYYVFARGRWLDCWWNDHFETSKVNIPLSDQTLQLWRQLVWQCRGVARSREQTMDYLLRALCCHLYDEMTAGESLQPAIDSLQAYRMKAYLEQHAGDNVSLQDVAGHVGLSVSRSVHLFKETFDRTMVQYLQEVRLKMACDRIRFSAMSLEEAAETSGFRSYSYFYRVFRSRYGMSPKQFRANLK